jgi:hypothetical protein
MYYQLQFPVILSFQFQTNIFCVFYPSLYEPQTLPFGGTYIGLAEYETLAVPKIQGYYDFNRFEFIGIYAERNVVFGLLKIGIKNSEKSLSLCEQFTFDGNKIKEIKVFVMTSNILPFENSESTVEASSN